MIGLESDKGGEVIDNTLNRQGHFHPSEELWRHWIAWIRSSTDIGGNILIKLVKVSEPMVLLFKTGSLYLSDSAMPLIWKDHLMSYNDPHCNWKYNGTEQNLLTIVANMSWDVSSYISLSLSLSIPLSLSPTVTVVTQQCLLCGWTSFQGQDALYIVQLISKKAKARLNVGVL